MVSCFLGEDLSKVSIFHREGDFGFCLLHSDGKLHCGGEFSNDWRVREETFTIASEDPVDEAVIQGVLEVLVLHVMV